MYISLSSQDTEALRTVLAHLEESLKPPDLKDSLANEDGHLEYAPPLYSSIRALGGVAVYPFTDDNVGLFVFDLGQKLGECAD